MGTLSLKRAKAPNGFPEHPISKEVILKLVRSFLPRVDTYRGVLAYSLAISLCFRSLMNGCMILGMLGPPASLLTSTCSCFRFVLSNFLVSRFFGKQS